MLPKLIEMEQNWVIFTPYGFIKNFWPIHLRESHVKFMGKNKVGNRIPREQNYAAWLVKNGKFSKQFSVNLYGIFLCQYQASTWPLVYFLKFLDTFQFFYIGCYFSGIFYTFCFKQILFTGFLTSTFDFYWKFGPTIFMFHSKTFMVSLTR